MATDPKVKFQFPGHFRTLPVISTDCRRLSQYSISVSSLPSRLTMATDPKVKFQFPGHFRTLPVISTDCRPLSQYNVSVSLLPGRLTMATDPEVKFQFPGHFRTLPVISTDCRPLSQYSVSVISLPGGLTIGKGVSTSFPPRRNSGQHCYQAIDTSRGLARGKCHQYAIALSVEEIDREMRMGHYWFCEYYNSRLYS